MEVDGVSDLNEAAELIDTTAPGSLPFVDFAISDFAELVAATQQLQATLEKTLSQVFDRVTSR